MGRSIRSKQRSCYSRREGGHWPHKNRQTKMSTSYAHRQTLFLFFFRFAVLIASHVPPSSRGSSIRRRRLRRGSKTFPGRGDGIERGEAGNARGVHRTRGTGSTNGVFSSTKTLEKSTCPIKTQDTSKMAALGRLRTGRASKGRPCESDKCREVTCSLNPLVLSFLLLEA